MSYFQKNSNNNYEKFNNFIANPNSNSNYHCNSNDPIIHQNYQDRICRVVDFNKDTTNDIINKKEPNYIKYVIASSVAICLLIVIIIVTNKSNNKNDNNLTVKKNQIESSTLVQADNTEDISQDSLNTLDNNSENNNTDVTPVVDGYQDETTNTENSTASNTPSNTVKPANKSNKTTQTNKTNNTTTTTNKNNSDRNNDTNKNNNNNTSSSDRSSSEQTGSTSNTNQIHESVNNTPVRKDITVYPVNGVFYPFIKGTPNAISSGVVNYYDASGSLVSKPWSVQLDEQGEGKTTVSLPSNIHQYEFVINKTVLKGSVNAEVVSYLYSFEI